MHIPIILFAPVYGNLLGLDFLSLLESFVEIFFTNLLSLFADCSFFVTFPL